MTDIEPLVREALHARDDALSTTPERLLAGVRRCRSRRLIQGGIAATVVVAVGVLGLSALRVDRRPGSVTATPAASSATSEPAVRPAPQVGGFGRITGTLHGDPRSRCLWLENGATRQQLVLLGDYAVEFVEGQVVVLQNGAVLARGGDTVSFGGGLSTDAGVAGCVVAPVDGRVWGGTGGHLVTRATPAG